MPSLYVNADWSALVPAGSPDAAFGIQPKDAKRRGLLPLQSGETLGEPEKLMTTPNVVTVGEDGPEVVALPEPEPEPEPKAKEAPKPADKAAKKPATK
jgi:hypothetical protein